MCDVKKEISPGRSSRVRTQVKIVTYRTVETLAFHPHLLLCNVESLCFCQPCAFLFNIVEGRRGADLHKKKCLKNLCLEL